MQTEAQRNKETGYVNVVPPNNLRKEQKRIFLVEKDQPKKSVLSFGDFRHNVMTREEAYKYSDGLLDKPSRFIEWREDVSKQKFDKPVAAKIGARF